MAILEVEHIFKRFGDTEVLKGITFSLEQGQALAIIGSSGSGKTTLLRCLNFLEKPDAGIIRVGGNVLLDTSDPTTQQEAQIRKKRLHFGLVFQSFNLFPQYTVLKNITLASELLAKEQADRKAGAGKAALQQIEAEAYTLLEQMGLTEKARSYPHQLSGGQQQRVAIARALALHPSILCFDEPTSALDPELTGEVLRVIRSLAAKKTTMVIVTHEMAFARDVADHVIFMDDGVIVEAGRPEDVISNPREERTRQFLQRFSKEAAGGQGGWDGGDF
ncbi:MAG: amino acid ABC transporter ATP-binding protein [Ruminococcaceae bacterium]|nr:amino acid ABC transporter ATP-binding protein [Oscillospiraceae bacterium]